MTISLEDDDVIDAMIRNDEVVVGSLWVVKGWGLVGEVVVDEGLDSGAFAAEIMTTHDLVVAKSHVWIYVCRCVGEWMHGWMDAWVDRWMDAWTDA